VSKGLTSHLTFAGHFRDSLNMPDDRLNQQCQSTKGSQMAVKISPKFYHVTM